MRCDKARNDQRVVDAHVAKLVLDDGDLLAVCRGEYVVEQRRLPRSEESGEYCDGHEVLLVGHDGSGSLGGREGVGLVPVQS